jgi:hypothetical protein
MARPNIGDIYKFSYGGMCDWFKVLAVTDCTIILARLDYDTVTEPDPTHKIIRCNGRVIGEPFRKRFGENGLFKIGHLRGKVSKCTSDADLEFTAYWG